MAYSFAPADVNVIPACQESHKLSFYCQECNRLFCGDCSTRTHKGPNKGHDIEEIDELVAREAAEILQLEGQLKELSENAKLAAMAKDAIGEKTHEMLTQFVSEIERLLLTGQSAREALQLYGIHRECIALLQHSSATHLDVDPHDNPIGALVAYRKLSSRLTEYMEKTRESVKNAEIIRDFDITEAILQTAISKITKGKDKGEGVL